MLKRRIEATVFIKKGEQEIFEFMTDFSKSPQWSNVSEIKLISGDPIGVGTQYLEVFSSNGRIEEIPAQITILEPFTKWGFKSKSKAFELEMNYILEPEEEGTKVTGVGELDLTILSLSLTSHLIIVPMIQKRLENSLKSLKNVLELQLSKLPSAIKLPSDQ